MMLAFYASIAPAYDAPQRPRKPADPQRRYIGHLALWRCGGASWALRQAAAMAGGVREQNVV